MTIEASAPPAAPSARSASDTRARKSHAQGGADSAPALGFMAVLSAVDDSVGEQEAVALSDFDKNKALAPVDTAQAAIENVANLMLAMPIPALAQGASAEVSVTLAGDAAPFTAAHGLKAALRVDADTSGGAQAGLAIGDSDESGVATKGAQKAWMGHWSDKAAVASKVGEAVDMRGTGAAQGATKAQDTQFLASLDAMKTALGGNDAGSTQALTATASATVERSTGERLHTRERDTEGQLVASFSPLGATSYASSAVQEAGGIAPEMQVAQQVTYWISQDIQNAELTLDGLGKDAVEVSISMNGNEAHVAFRTDELQARTMLEGATAHLKDLLHSEGLVLSGVSVGTSGSNDAGSGERKQRQGTRHTGLVPVTAAAAEARRPQATGATGRTLDLFV